MHYGAQKSTGPWSLTFRLRTEPRCPGCAEFLQPIVTEVRAGWAWCPLCAGHALHAVPHLAFVLEHAAMAAHSSIQHGIRFYTPKASTGKPMNALEFYEAVLKGATFELTRAGREALETAPPAAAVLAAGPVLPSPPPEKTS